MQVQKTTTVRATLPARFLNALAQAGLTYEQALRMPLDDLAKLDGIGPKMLEIFAQRTSRVDEWLRCRANPAGFLELSTGERVMYREIDRARRTRDVLFAFGYYNGVEDEPRLEEIMERFQREVPDEAIARYLINLSAADKAAAAMYQHSLEKAAEEQEFDNTFFHLGLDSTSRRRLAKLEREFLERLRKEYDVESAPVNDQEQVKHLASLMARRALHDQRARDLAARIADAAVPEGEKAKAMQEYAWVQKQLNDINAAIDRIQTSLQMTPQARAAAQSATQAWQVVQDLVKASKGVVMRLARYHRSGPHVMGYTVWYHPHPDHKPYCAECGGSNIVYRGLHNDVNPLVLWTTEAEALYTRAADFKPSGAPKGIGVFD